MLRRGGSAFSEAVNVQFPRSRKLGAAREPRDTMANIPRGRETILVAENEKTVRGLRRVNE